VSNVRYDLQVLDSPWGGGDGFGYGINDGGEAVGEVALPSVGGPAIWWWQAQPNLPTVPFFPDLPVGGELLKVDDFGNAVGLVNDGSPDPWPAIVNGTSLIADLRSLGMPSDINNQATVTGTDFSGGPTGGIFGSRAFIYTFFPIPGNQIWLSPLPNSTGIAAEAINDLGDVVGGCDNGAGLYGAGFFYSALTKKMTAIDSCFLRDINVNRLAVGGSASGQPIMVDLSKASPVLQSIPVPEPFVGAVATAVNSSNTIVGFCNSQGFQDSCAFVSYNSPAPRSWLTFNLNDLLSASTPYTLVDAMDINEAGQIVGSAVLGPLDKITGVYAYVATPFTVPPPPQGPVRRWPVPIWLWPWGWLPGPVPPSFFGPSPLVRLPSPISRIPITGKRASDLQKMLAAHRARIFRSTESKKRRLTKLHKTRGGSGKGGA